MARAGGARGRGPVKTGAHRDIEGLIGAPPSPKSHPDLDDLPPGWKSSHDLEQEDELRDSALRTEYRAQERARVRGQNRPPAAASRGGNRVRRTAGARRSASPGRRRRGRPSFTDPTGGRLPITLDGQGLAGLFFGAIGYALVLSIVEYGPGGPLLWFKAKFLNQAAGAASSSTTSAPAGSSGAKLL